MTDDELRALVRQAVSRHLGTRTAAPVPVLPERAARPTARHGTSEMPWAAHVSHLQYMSLVNTSDACVIEPSAPCDHCGYCKSHGH